MQLHVEPRAPKSTQHDGEASWDRRSKNGLTVSEPHSHDSAPRNKRRFFFLRFFSSLPNTWVGVGGRAKIPQFARGGSKKVKASGSRLHRPT